MDISNWIALGVGGYAAIVATAALIWNILRERRKIKVKIKYALGFGVLSGQEMVAIEVVNNGVRDINIQEHGFLCSDKKTRLINPFDEHSGRVISGDSKSYYIPIGEVRNMVREAKLKGGLKIIGAYVRDGTGTYYKAGIQKKLKEEFFKA